MYGSSPFRSTLNTGYITALDMCEECTEAVHSIALLNTGYITALGMCEVCIGAGSPFCRTLNTGLQLWTCVCMYRSSPFRSTLNTGYITALDMCEV